MMRRGFVQWRLQIVAQRGGQRRFIARLHPHRVDQRREQAFAFGMEQIAQRLDFGGAALDLMFGFFQRRARLDFGASASVRRARAASVVSRKLAEAARAASVWLVGMEKIGRAFDRILRLPPAVLWRR